MLSLPRRSLAARFTLAFVCLAGLGLAATPPGGPRAASVAPVAAPGESPREAYLADLMDMAHPVFLGLEEAEILAEHLEIGVKVFQLRPDSPQDGPCPEIRYIATLNKDFLEPDSPFSLLFHHRHFAVIAPREEQEIAEFVFPVGPHLEQFIQVGEFQDAGYRPVPADGHCLITALFFIAYERFPSAGEVAELRALLAASLTPEQVAEALQEMLDDLIQNAAERPLENGRFASYGPRTSAMVAADPRIMAARERKLEPHRQQLAALEAGRAAHPEAHDDQAELAAAIALSLTLNRGETIPAGPALAPAEPALEPDEPAGDPEEPRAKRARFTR